MSALISIMVDNGNNPYAGKLGLNKHATTMTANGIALGISLETLLLMLNHPTIVQNYFKANNKKKTFDKGIVKLIQEEYDVLIADSDIRDDSSKEMVTDSMMRRHINTYEELKEKDEVTREMEVERAAILKEFLNLARIKSANDNLAGIAQRQTGMGRDIDVAEATKKNITELGLNLSKQEYDKTTIPFEYNFVTKFNNPRTITGSNKKVFENFVNYVLPRLVITASEPFKKISNLANESLDPKLGPDQRRIAEEKIRKDLLSYLTIKAYIHDLSKLGNEQSKSKLASLNNALIYDEMEGTLRINQIIKDIKKVLREKKIKSTFIEDYIDNQKNGTQGNTTGINRIQTKPFIRLINSQITTLQSSFLELLKYEGTRDKVSHLIHYEMVKNGLQKKAGSYNNIIPPILLSQYLENARKVKDLFSEKFKSEEIEDNRYKSIFGSTFNTLASDFLVNWFKSSIDTHYVTKIKKKGASVLNYNKRKYKDTTVRAVDIDSNLVMKSANKNKIFIIPDSIKQNGYHDMERTRDFGNVYSIPVMLDKENRMTDATYKENTNAIDAAIKNIEDNIEGVSEVVLPKTGIGTGQYYLLSQTAPETKAYLDNILKEKFGYINGVRKLKTKTGTTAEMSLADAAVDKLKAETKTTIVKRKDTGDQINIKPGKSKLVKFGKDWYNVTNRGYIDVEKAGGVDEMLQSEGHESIEAIPKHLTDIKAFIQGEQKGYVYDVEKAKAPEQEMKNYDATAPNKGTVSSPMILRDTLEGMTYEIDSHYNTKKRDTVKKGKRKKETKTKWEKDGQEWKNVGNIMRAGFESISSNNNVKMIKFPPVIRIEFVDNSDKKYYKYFALTDLWAYDTKGQYTDDIYSSQDTQNSLYGSRAIYKEFIPVGSKNTWKGAFVFNIKVNGKLIEQPNIKQIRDNLNKLKETKQSNLPDSDNFDETSITLPGEKPKKTPLGDTKADRVDVDNDKADYKKDDETIGSTSNESPDDFKNKNLSSEVPEDIKKASANLFSKAEGQGAKVTKDQMQSAKTGTNYSELEAWFFDPARTPQEIRKVATAMNLPGATYKDFINGFEKIRKNVNLPTYQVKDYVDRIKSCY